jgi:predicted DNA binding CopG/RHH family protein
MDKAVDPPEFKSEEEEALWWDSHQGFVLDLFKEAAKAGTLRRGTIVRRGETPTTTIRIDPKDVELAKVQAEERGLRYQTYLKMIIHQALKQVEESKA